MQLYVDNENKDSGSKDGPTIHPFLDTQLAASIGAWSPGIPRHLRGPTKPQDVLELVNTIVTNDVLEEPLSEQHVCPREQNCPQCRSYWKSFREGSYSSNTLFPLVPQSEELWLNSKLAPEVYLNYERMQRAETERDIAFSVMRQIKCDEIDRGSLRSERIGSKQGGSSSRGYVQSLFLGTTQSTTTHNDLCQRDAEELRASSDAFSDRVGMPPDQVVVKPAESSKAFENGPMALGKGSGFALYGTSNPKMKV